MLPCLTVLLLLLLSLTKAQYENLGYPPGYPEPELEQYSAPQLSPDTPRIQLRLAGDKRKHNEGRVEVFYNSEWGTVCDDDFTLHAAQVVCRELGYLEAVSWSPSSKYGKGEGGKLKGSCVVSLNLFEDILYLHYIFFLYLFEVSHV